MLKVFIVDHHPTERLGLRRILDRETDVQVAAETGSAEEALNLLSSMNVDVVIADIRMDQQSGLEFTRTVKEVNPNVGVLIVTHYDERDRIVEAVEQAGADGFLSKDAVENKLGDAIRNVAADSSFFVER